MSETGGPESKDYWFQEPNLSRWNCHSTDKEAVDRGQRLCYPGAHDKIRATHLDESGTVCCQSGAEGTQSIPALTVQEATRTGDVTYSGFMIEFQSPPPAASDEVSSQRDPSHALIGGIANMMRISPFRCAVCNVHFCKNGKKIRQWSPCGGGVWHPSYRRYYYCKAWLCRFDDQCQNAGAPCPCCKKRKKLQISIQPATEITDESCNATWYDERGVFHSLHDV
jgi:hypothetical protein